MKKKRILLASVLKPINDTRMYEKLGKSLSNSGKGEIHICGFRSEATSSDPNIFFHPLFYFTRLSLGRLLVSYRFFRLLRQLKPDVVIICQPELLPISLIYKLFRQVTLIYDIRENYKLNIQTQTVYPRVIRNFLGNGIRVLEKIASPYIHTFFLAERSYLPELPFVTSRYLILENKYQYPGFLTGTSTSGLTQKKATGLNLLYTGTISELYGIFEAVQFATILHQLNQEVTLTIIGYCPQRQVYQKLVTAIKSKPFIKLMGGNSLIPHSQIIEEIKKVNFGLLPYHLHPSLARCMPTKLYEYIANKLPVLITENQYWKPLVTSAEAGIFLNFNDFNLAEILNKMRNETFYSTKHKPDVFWESEESKLLRWADLTIFKD